MKSGWRIFLVMQLALGGCAGLRQFPESADNYAQTLAQVDPEYDEALGQIYAENATAADQKRIRNELLETRMAVIDRNFEDFVEDLAEEDVIAGLGIALVGVGVGGTGALVSETASQILSAVSAALTGGQAAYQKEVLFESTRQALIAQMIAGRKKVAAGISQRFDLGIADYPLWLARRDLEAYHFAGSLPGAVVATASDAAEKEGEAEQILFGAITQKVVTREAFEGRTRLREAVEGLDAARAKSLVDQIRAEFPSAEAFIEAQYPAATRAGDTDGSRARTVLARLVVLTAKTPQDRAKWQAAIDGL